MTPLSPLRLLPRRLRGMSLSLRSRYTIYGGLLAAGVAVILTSVSYVSTRAIIIEDAGKHLSGSVAAVKSPVEQSLALIHRDINGLARQSLIANALLDSHGRDAYLLPFLREHQLPVSANFNLVLTDHRGEPLAARRETRSYAASGVFQGLLERGTAKAEIESRDGRSNLLLALPIMYGLTGTYEGALIFETDLGELLAGPAARRLDEDELTSIQFMQGDKRISSIGKPGEPHQMFHDVRLDLPGWSLPEPLFVRIGVSDAMLSEPLSRLLVRHLLWGVLVIALSAAAAGMLARVQTRRIVALTDEARRLGRAGYRDAKLGRERFGRDEVGDLAVSFARLLGELQQHQDGLEQTVANRTRELAEREADLNRAQSVARIGSWTLDLANDELRWSAETYRLLGVEAGTPITYQLFLSRIHPEDRELVDTAWRAALAGAPYDIEHRVLCGDAVCWVREQAEIEWCPQSGQAVGAVGTIQDITERRAVEEQLRQLSTAVEQSPASIVITDPDGNIRYVNPQFERISGYGAGEVIGCNPRILKSGRMLPYEYASLWATISSGRIWRGELENVRKDGSHYWEIASISPIIMDDGAISGYVAVKEDITVQKQHERSIRMREAKLSALIDALPDMLMVVGPDGRIDDLHLPEPGLHERRAGTYLGQHCSVFLPPEMVARIEASLAQPGGITGQAVEFELSLRNGRRVFSASLNRLEEDMDMPAAIIVLARDVTQRKQDEARMREALVVYNASSQGIMTTDAGGLITAVNPAFSKITGFGESEVLGQHVSIFKSGRHDKDFYLQMWETIARSGAWEGELWNRRSTGEIYPQWLTISTVLDEAGKLIEYVAIFSDITQRKQQEDVIWRQANFDALTGLANRSLLHDRLERALAQARRSGRKVGVIFLDLDGFKWINDTLGHDVGDQLLVDVAQRLKGCVRDQDTVARLGGDEFTIIVHELGDSEDLHSIGEKCVDVLRAPYVLAGSLHHLSGSAGVTVFPDDGEDVQTLLRNADIAMYKSKQSGKNRFQFYARHMQDDALARMQMESDLRSALASEGFSLNYQPIVDAASGAIVGAEALMRWQHPGRGMVPPDQFIPVAEDSGLIVNIGAWALRHACQQIHAWQRAGFPPLRLAVNISGVQFREGGLQDLISEVLADSQIDRGQLLLEITESVLMDGSQAAEARMHAIKDLGIGYALDDFGTGFSSLSYLKRFPVDIVKVDRSFVRDCPDDRNDAHLVEAIIRMAHSLGLKVTAEGVETEAQAEFLKSLGCDYLQGYLISRPLPAEAFAEFMVRAGHANVAGLTGTETATVTSAGGPSVAGQPRLHRVIG